MRRTWDSTRRCSASACYADSNTSGLLRGCSLVTKDAVPTCEAAASDAQGCSLGAQGCSLGAQGCSLYN